MKQILIIMFTIMFAGCSAIAQEADPDITINQLEETAPAVEPADSTAAPVQFNEYLGIQIDSLWVLLEYAVIRQPTPGNEITRYMAHKEAWQVVTTDIWRNSRGKPRVDIFEQLGGQWVKVSPAGIIRVTPLQR